MARIDLTMPKMGESVAEATLVKWCKNIGDKVEMDETILEIATDKVDSEVPSPKSGILVEKRFKEDDIVLVGAVFGVLETDSVANPVHMDLSGLDKGTNGHHPEGKEDYPQPVLWEEDKAEALILPIPGMEALNREENNRGTSEMHPEPIPAELNPVQEDRFYSPLVREIARQEGLSRKDLDRIKGTGLEGRVTKNDILDFIQNGPHTANSLEPIPGPPVKLEEPLPTEPRLHTQIPSTENLVREEGIQEIPVIKEAPKPSGSNPFLEGDEIIAMDRMRRIISEHMVMSKNVSAHVTSFVEADVTNLVRWRERIKEEFKLREKENITYTPIFIEALAKVLKLLPMVNVSVKDNSIYVHRQINIGMATALPSGNLIVPVIKQADLMSLVGLSKKVNELAGKARAGKLSPDDTQGGTFTITNVGTFGNLMGTPIINQPQVAILATGAIVKKPAIIETLEGDVIAIRHKLFLSLSYDHRVVDGALGGTFLRKVADELEAFDPSRTI